MLMVSTILQAIQNKLDSPVALRYEESTVELINIVMKIARFNKACAKSVNTENAHQGCFATNQLLHHYHELLKLVCAYNKTSTNVQLQLKTAVFPLEGIFMGTIRLVSTNTKIILDHEKDALFRSLNYLKSKRSGSDNGRASTRGKRGRK